MAVSFKQKDYSIIAMFRCHKKHQERRERDEKICIVHEQTSRTLKRRKKLLRPRATHK